MTAEAADGPAPSAVGAGSPSAIPLLIEGLGVRYPGRREHSLAGIDLTFTIPPVGGEDFTEDTQLFRPRPPHGNLGYVVSELEMLLTGGRDGGLYTMIGRKR